MVGYVTDVLLEIVQVSMVVAMGKHEFSIARYVSFFAMAAFIEVRTELSLPPSQASFTQDSQARPA